MERKSTGASPFTLKPSTFKNKIKEDGFDIDDLVAEEKDADESSVVQKPKHKLLATAKAAILNFNRKPKKKSKKA